MQNVKSGRAAAALALAASLTLLGAGSAHACACGCGIFDIGAGSLMPNNADSGFSAWFRYSYMDQNRNLEGSRIAPAADNADKQIDTNFYTFGGQYAINRSWAVMAELPIYSRALTTTDDGTVAGPAGSIYTGHITDIGDLQLTAIYTGLSADQSTGLGLGVKAPTGNDRGPTGPLGGAEFDRDSLPGTGSTDLMFSAYHVGSFNAANTLSYFVQTRYQVAVATRGGYRPGNEWDSAAGVTYDLGRVGPVMKISPLLQILNSFRAHDTGPAADPLNSGYERVLISPGVQMRLTRKVHLFIDAAFPIYQHTNSASSLALEGESGQLVAPVLLTMQLAYDF